MGSRHVDRHGGRHGDFLGDRRVWRRSTRALPRP